jgi:triacylglycerol lipase
MIIPRLRAPIVLVHGLCGFDNFSLGGWKLAEYFPGIPQALQIAGNRVLTPRLSPTRGIADRAAQLKQFLDRALPNEQVHVIAHSLGGLDARYMISRLDMGGRVLSLTTLGTPHRGSAFADWGISRLSRVVNPLLKMLSIPSRAFYDLTTSACRAFNKQVPDVPRVHYLSVAGDYDGKTVRPEWLLPYHIVLESEGPNDGVVSVTSATYGEGLETWPGDHLSMVNWPNFFWPSLSNPGRGLTVFHRVLRRLADDGY